MTPEEYVEAAGQRMAADGCQVSWEQIGPVRALVGYRKSFRGFGMMHLSTVFAAFPPSGFAVDRFSADVATYAKGRAGAGFGLWGGAAAFAVIVSDHVPQEAALAASRRPSVDFAARTQPVVVDTSTRAIDTFTGTMLWGWALNGFLRRNREKYVVPPA